MKIKTSGFKPVIIILMFTVSILPAIALGRSETERETVNFFALGTTCSVSIDVDSSGRAAGSEVQADEVFKGTEDLINSIENSMSVNIEDSEINRINTSAGIRAEQVSQQVIKVITAGKNYSRLSGGAFDISIGPLVMLWGIGGDGAAVPSQSDIEEALTLIDYSQVQISGDTIYLPTRGMRLEPGGIAKGWAADRAAEYLRSKNIESALINLGGNVLALGSKKDGSPWRIGVQNPDNTRGEYLGIVTVTGKAVVSSGKYERYFVEDGKRYHHILSTENGYPVENGIAQVSIICAESMTADAMSTSVFSLGLEAGLALAETTDGVEAIIITDEGNIYLTEGIRDSFKLTDSSFNILGE
ncbi:MAG: FAD:protein FMN transferase [Spirochaetales bacterium]|nr:FAD:protein FMN transferase [Spirochaetales bacterium]